MEELAKHRVNKEREPHHHHHMHLFHFPGHHHKEHQQQQTAATENYRVVSSAIDEPSVVQATSSSNAHFKLTVELVWRWRKMTFSGKKKFNASLFCFRD